MNHSFIYKAVALTAVVSSVHSVQAIAQTAPEASGDIIKQGVSAYEGKKYKEAAVLFARVPEGDTNFAIAQYELALSYVADSAFAKAKDILAELLEHPAAEPRNSRLLLASVYDYLGESEASLREYRNLAGNNPNDHQPLFEMGILYFRKENLDSAIHYFQKTLLVYPRHAKAMQFLGTSYALQGRLTEAWMCLQTCLLSTNNMEAARTPLRFLSGIARQTDDFSKPYKEKKEQFAHPLFDDIDAILHSRVILSDDYKIKSVLSDELLAKVTYAVMEKLRYDREDSNFVMQFIVPLWVDINSKSLIDPFLIQSFSGFEIEKIDKLAAKEKKDVAKVIAVINPYLDQILATRTLHYEQRKTAPLKYKMLIAENIYYDGVLKALNEFDEGPVHIYQNGLLIAKGAFNKAQEKNGKWDYYYPSGIRKSTESLTNGKLTGTDTSWYENGLIKSEGRYDAQGKSVFARDYNENGIATETYEVVNDDVVRNTSFYESGGKVVTVLLSKKEYQDGAYEGWHENGKLKRNFIVKNGKLSGTYKDFYDDGQPEGVYEYKDGVLDGAYISYHRNGKTAFKATYKDGKEEGLLERWNDNGNPSAREEYKNGKLNGKSIFFDEGREYGYVLYADGKPVEYAFQDMNGKAVASAKGPLTVLKTYYSNGNIKAEFPLKDGMFDGLVKYYSYGGTLTEEVEYKASKKEGRETGFFKNGKKSREVANKDDHSMGWYKGYHYNGNLIAEGWLENGEKQGVWTYQYANGKQDSRSFNMGDIANGPVEEYNIQGELIQKEYYFNKTLYRLRQYDSTGKVCHQCDFPNGSGTYTLLEPLSGKKWFECNVAHGRLEGTFTKIYPDGQNMETGTYKAGKKDGLIEGFAFNGVKVSTGIYQSGKREGVWEFYDEAGAHISTMTYKGGELNGKRISYGVINYESTYVDGRKEGEQRIFDREKHLLAVLYFSEGILMGYSYEGSDGKLLAMIPLKNGTGKVTTFYANGKPAADLAYDESTQEGKQTYYFTNGSIAEQRLMHNGDYDGEMKEYHENGKLRLSCTYKNDELHGQYQRFDENGKLLISKYCVYDQEHGVVELIDPKTQQLKKMLYRYGYAVRTL